MTDPIAMDGLIEEVERITRNRDMWKGQCERQAAELTALRERAERLAGALRKIAPIRVHDGPDYAEVYFADGSTHSTQAMTMNPQDWLDIHAALADFEGEANG